MRENRLKWFGNVQRRLLNVLVRKSGIVHIEGNTREGGKPKLMLVKLGKKDMIIYDLTKAMANENIEFM